MASKWTRTSKWAIEVASRNSVHAADRIGTGGVPAQGGVDGVSSLSYVNVSNKWGGGGQAPLALQQPVRGRGDVVVARQERREGAVPVEAHRH